MYSQLARAHLKRSLAPYPKHREGRMTQELHSCLRASGVSKRRVEQNSDLTNTKYILQ